MSEIKVTFQKEGIYQNLSEMLEYGCYKYFGFKLVLLSLFGPANGRFEMNIISNRIISISAE